MRSNSQCASGARGTLATFLCSSFVLSRRRKHRARCKAAGRGAKQNSWGCPPNHIQSIVAPKLVTLELFSLRTATTPLHLLPPAPDVSLAGRQSSSVRRHSADNAMPFFTKKRMRITSTGDQDGIDLTVPPAHVQRVEAPVTFKVRHMHGSM